MGVTVAHEINQPLMAVVLNGDACLRWLQAAPPNLAEIQKTVSRMVEEGARAGKFGGSTVAPRMAGVPWKDATSLGILMNTRGLMELVALNIGLDIGVITPTVFTVMVLMALVTTFMTSLLLELVYPARLMLIENEQAA